MTALSQEKMSFSERWNYKQFTLASGNKAWKHGIACLDVSTGKVEPGHAESDLLVIGKFAETVDATSADKLVNIKFPMEIDVEWWSNDTGTPVVATDLGKVCYVLDDQTVTMNPVGAPAAGRVWGVSSTKGVAVQKLETVAPDRGLLIKTAAPAYTVNDLIIAASPASRAVIDIPTTTGASTVTLPAAADEGAELTFVADGTKNGHTVQYRDATGPTNLTTALTASKRHLVIAVFLNGKWNANAYVSP